MVVVDQLIILNDPVAISDGIFNVRVEVIHLDCNLEADGFVRIGLHCGGNGGFTRLDACDLPLVADSDYILVVGTPEDILGCSHRHHIDIQFL